MTIAYLDSRKIEGKFIGGLLSVDERGIPVEFKYTDPVVPNELQKILYGSSIDTYLKGELIAKTLLKKMEKNRISFLYTIRSCWKWTTGFF